MMYNENSFYVLLQEIRKEPRFYLGTKSLEFLVHFWHGYGYGGAVKEWEKSLGKKLEDCEVTIDFAVQYALDSNSSNHRFMDGFDEFVRSYYKSTLAAISGTGLILGNSSSDEEAFDKFFELFDEFLKQKNPKN